ncbi:MAG TPA: hypothetical protein VFI92_06950 [Steroidobacteraceae bacterium]|nr:hypothetical protein [Steroidobacteraceae bacterium]
MALELPAVTVADRVAAVLALLAGVFPGWILARHGLPGLAALALVVAVGTAAARIRIWKRSRLRPALRLELLPDGSLQVCGQGQNPRPATLGPRTRRLGPSVFLEVDFASGGRRARYGRWLTRFDVPEAALRRWTVVLPTCGRTACS